MIIRSLLNFKKKKEFVNFTAHESRHMNWYLKKKFNLESLSVDQLDNYEKNKK